ncbi:PHB depolymerase family esterase [Kutzneria buriramensis]|nr:PHB depolymerase family esterase [Kutzneria buriramensis]
MRRLLAVAAAAAIGLALPGVASADDNPVHDYPILSFGCLNPQTPDNLGTTVDETITSGGIQRDYLIHVPTSYRPFHPMPVVMAFHGRKGDGSDIAAFSGIDSLDAIAVYPVGAKGEADQRAWESAPYAAVGVDDVKFVSDLLDHLQGTLCVDPNRIFATGKSNGAGFVALLACQLPLRIAAFGTIAGAYYPGTTTGCDTSPPAPIVDFHGTADPTIAYDGDVSHGVPTPPLMVWAQGKADHNHCTATPEQTNIGTDVIEFAWTGCAQHENVTHYRILGAGHTWPGELVDSGPGSATQTIKATQVIWNFFTAHPLLLHLTH